MIFPGNGPLRLRSVVNDIALSIKTDPTLDQKQTENLPDVGFDLVIRRRIGRPSLIQG